MGLSSIALYSMFSDICNNSLGRRDKVITCRPQGHPGRTKIYWKADVTCQERGGCELQQGERLCSGEGP